MNKKIRDVLTQIIVKAMIIKGYSDVKDMHRNTIDARKKNDRLLFKILKTNEDCELGKKYNFKDIKTIEDYRRIVPLSDFPAYEEYIKRMIKSGKLRLVV